MAPEEPGSPPAPRGDLDPQITAKLEQMFAAGLCKPGDVDAKVRQQLRVLPISDALDALVRMENALKTGPVHKFSAYLASVIRRITQVAPEASGAPMHLHPQAQDILERLYAIGLVHRGDLDGRALAALGAKPPELQLLVMETFRDRNLRGIRNMAAFFTSHQTQVEKDLRDGALRLPRLGAPPPQQQQQGGRYGGPPPPGPAPGYDPAYPHAPPPHHAPHGGGYGAPPPGPAAASYPQHRPPYAPQQPAPYPGMPTASAPPLPAAPSLPKDLAANQAAWGIRIEEFHGLSPFAKYVSPAAALRLQQLWDVEQNKLVSVLNEASWEAVAGLDAAAGVAAVNACAEAMKSAPDDLATINSIFISIAAKYPKRPDAPSLATLALAAAGAALPPLPQPQPQQQPQYLAPPPQQYGGAPPPLQQPPSPYRGGPPQPYGGGPLPPYGGPPPYGGGPPPPQPDIRLPGPCGSLPPIIQAEIDRVLRQWGGLLKLVHFEGRAVDMLHRMGERNALAALEEFGRNDPQHMRSPTAYLIGCIKKFDSEEGGGGGGPGGDPGGGPGGGHHRHEDEWYGGGYRGGRGGRGGRRGGRGGRGRYGGRDGDRDAHWQPY